MEHLKLGLVVLMVFFAGITSAQIVLNEVCPANADVIYDKKFYNFSPWVELYNSGSSAVHIGGYYLSDDETNSMKWRIPDNVRIPAKGFVIFWCDNQDTGNHTNFLLDSEGEDVVVSNTAGIVLDKISYPKQFANVSYGRISNGSGSWAFLSVPTPSSGNNPSTATEQADKPSFSLPGGRYTNKAVVSIVHKRGDAKIYFTTDGSEPTTASKPFTSPITISKTQTLKAKAFVNGLLPGETAVQTYFINEHDFTLPVVSISMKPDYLYDNTIGIYVKGTNGIPGPCSGEPENWNQDWYRHAEFEYYDAKGSRLFHQSVDVRIGGNCSRAGQPQKPLVIRARSKYGNSIMNYKFFQNKNIHQFGGLMLRNSGNDFNITMFRDAFMQYLPSEQMDVDYMDYQPTIVYLNGQYMGIQNLREKIDGDFITSNYNIDKNNIDLLENESGVLEGSAEGYQNYLNALENMDRSTQAAYDFIDQHIDVQEYINYLVCEIYYANTDWPWNNQKFWRPTSANGKFRWILYDTDFGFFLANDPSHRSLDFITPEWPNRDWSTLHIRLLFDNPLFRARFIQTMNAALNTTFEPGRVIAIINQFQERIRQEMPYHKLRWGGDINSWNNEVEQLRLFATARNSFMRSYMAELFDLHGSVNIATSIAQGEGKFKLNGVTAEANTVQPYLKNLPLQIEAVPALGYTLKEWRISRQKSESITLIDAGSSWKYFDKGTSPVNWNNPAFDDASWAEGLAQFGYGENDEKTIVSYGSDPNNKYVTTYFRKLFTVADATSLEQLAGSILVDDGAVIYLNGVELIRTNMPGGPINYSTFSLQATQEGVYIPFSIPKGILKSGDNVLAVEIHQNSATSTDLSFDLTLGTVRLGEETIKISSDVILLDTAFSNISYEASFEPSGTVVNNIVINEISTRPSTVLDNAGEAEDWIELFNEGSEAVNLAGLYLTDNLVMPTKYQLPPNVGILQPGEYKILWADDDLTQGTDHLGFKLSSDGEAVGLYQKLGNQIHALDEYVYSAQQIDGSFSRVPNGTGPFTFTHVSTPSAFNELITRIDDDNRSIRVYPNPTKDFLFIESSTPVQVSLMDCLGRTLQHIMNVNQQQVSLENEPPGIYFLRLQSGSILKTFKVIKE